MKATLPQHQRHPSIPSCFLFGAKSVRFPFYLCNFSSFSSCSSFFLIISSSDSDLMSSGSATFLGKKEVSLSVYKQNFWDC